MNRVFNITLTILFLSLNVFASQLNLKCEVSNNQASKYLDLKNSFKDLKRQSFEKKLKIYGNKLGAGTDEAFKVSLDDKSKYELEVRPQLEFKASNWDKRRSRLRLLLALIKDGKTLNFEEHHSDRIMSGNMLLENEERPLIRLQDVLINREVYGKIYAHETLKSTIISQGFKKALNKAVTMGLVQPNDLVSINIQCTTSKGKEIQYYGFNLDDKICPKSHFGDVMIKDVGNVIYSDEIPKECGILKKYPKDQLEELALTDESLNNILIRCYEAMESYGYSW